MNLQFLFTNFCSLSDIPTSQSPSGQVWKVVFTLWSDFWPYILGFSAFVVISELITRHKNSYNSANGFTPDFNRLVGSFSYMLLQFLMYIILKFVVGDIAYCFPWPYTAHFAVFSLNFAILHLTGFWPEKKQSRSWRRRRKW